MIYVSLWYCNSRDESVWERATARTDRHQTLMHPVYRLTDSVSLSTWVASLVEASILWTSCASHLQQLLLLPVD